MNAINVAVVGVGNCASSLLQGLYFYRELDAPAAGLRRMRVGPYGPADIKVVAAFDIDRRKVGKDLSKAIFALPNSTRVFYPDVPVQGVPVSMSPVLDGVSEHMRHYDEDRTFVVADAREPDMDAIVSILRTSRTQVLVNYLPVGSEQATRFYVECALRAGAAVVNCIPVFIASDAAWAGRFARAGLPVIGDDIKSQMGATILHRTLAELFEKRGVRLRRTYQLNTGGNTDFLNMLNRDRLASKKRSKTEAVQSAVATRLSERNIHVGPSDYVPWQDDNKVSYIRMEGEIFGEVPIDLELRLSVEDSPNSSGVVIDAIRCAKLALDRGCAGPLLGPCASFCKHPPRQFSDDEAARLTEDYIRGEQRVEAAVGAGGG